MVVAEKKKSPNLSVSWLTLYALGSVFPTEHSLRTRTQVRDKCTQVHDQNRSSNFAKSVPFRADKPFLSEKNWYKSEFTVVSLVANRRPSMIYRLRSRVRGRDASLNDSVGYELRGKLGVPLRFLSRTAQPPKQSSPKEAMALNASHAIKFSLRKTSVKATKLERRRSNESRQPWRRRRPRGQMANVLADRHQTCVLPARNVILGQHFYKEVTGRTCTSGN